jgi:glycosyl transferase, family 25
MNLLNQFQRVYIVNLAERHDRRKEIEIELNQLGHNVDGQRIRFFSAIRPEQPDAFPSCGARGCFLSHLNILKEALRDGLDNLLILEDDLTFYTACHAVTAPMTERISRNDWDFAYLGHNELTSQTESPAWLVTGNPVATTHFYAINGHTLPQLVAFLESCLMRPAGHPQGGAMHVDGAYSFFRMNNPHVVTLLSSPSLGGQRSSRSDIYPNKWYDRIAFTRQLATFARGLKNKKSKILTRITGDNL